MKKKKRIKSLSLQKVLVGLLIALLLCAFEWVFEKKSSIQHPHENDKPAELYANQTRDDLRQVFLQGINESNQCITLIIYTLSDPVIIKALKGKAENGINVQVICDAKASPKISQKLGPKVKIHKHISKGLMHQKILVVDKYKTWIGSANMTSESLRMHGNLITVFNSPEMASVITEKAEKTLFPKDLTFLENHHEFFIGGQRVELCFFPEDSYGVDRLTQLIRSAQKTIRIAMFTWTRTDLAQEVTDANQRGVKAEVVVDYHSGKGASSKIVQFLLQKNIPVCLSQGNGLLHHKFMYIDNKILVNGSANWTKAAFTKNEDCYIILHDLTEQQKEFLERLWKVIVLESEGQTLKK